MSAPQMPSAASGAPVRILELHEDYAYEKLFRVMRARLQYRRFDGQMSAPLTRLNFERGESVGVLLYNRSDDTVILARQFRYPVYAALPPDEQSGEGAGNAWLLEIVAGVKEPELAVEDVANKELLEEAGYELAGELHRIGTFYPSPGGTSERMTLFWAEVDDRQRTGAGGGVVAEGEDIQMVAISFPEAMRMIANGQIGDAKTVLALQHLALLKGSWPHAGQREGLP